MWGWCLPHQRQYFLNSTRSGEFRFDFWQRARVMREAHLANRAPRMVESCFKFNRACDYLPVCSSEASIDDALLYERITTQHPELRD